MENEILKIAVNQGLWAVLFVVLLFYVLKKQEERDKKAEEREGKYQEIITQLTKKLDVLDDVKEKVTEVREKIFK